MNHRTPSFARVLLLLVAVAVGPLQAQTVFACAMMGTVMQDECCCDDHEATQGCTDSSCGAVLESSESPCCEQSVEIGIDDTSSQENPIVNIKALNLPEVQDYISLSSHQANSNLVIMGEKWNELSADQQKVLTDAVTKAVEQVGGCVAEDEQKFLAQLQQERGGK